MGSNKPSKHLIKPIFNVGSALVTLPPIALGK